MREYVPYAFEPDAMPDWDAADKVHDWRNYVPEEVRAVWLSLFTPEQRALLARWADHMASQEVWD